MLIFVSGGARSGKNRYAEDLAAQLAQKKCVYYYAASIAYDDEMDERIARHQAERPASWQTREAPFEPEAVLHEAEPGDVVLFDCLTTWLARMMFMCNRMPDELEHELNEWLKVTEARGLTLIIISNDVNEEVPPHDRRTKQYIHTLQLLHRKLTSEADRAVQMIAGLPLEWKAQ
ncbi:adenosylcobinamide kinase /adenosylcobinamide-phosphate guanylyltransferase [Salsuginibacillus halophilus]|uniref:Adenosylcobinamide kinase n=1 Tax=Salsuginibacillus halophilus TaxID=517424 RepID=A0A2P8HL26_9BACI|nr:bifunctional adenosylcobinamide kinase/adenosylcobinamide-phosphate guanylyltransferase [Salsuginibacillus halophilus]PSL46919.1 adenosylcobinamide kinase /adenosylcobinamide-phosphate guanylyltransferase [Salsuginibacillus halophilus]